MHKIASSAQAHGLALISFDLEEVIIQLHDKVSHSLLARFLSDDSIHLQISIQLSHQPGVGGYRLMFENLDSLPSALLELDGVFEERFNQAAARVESLAEFLQVCQTRKRFRGA